MKIAFFIVLAITVVLAGKRIYEIRFKHQPHGVISYAGAAAIVMGAITAILGITWATMVLVVG